MLPGLMKHSCHCLVWQMWQENQYFDSPKQHATISAGTQQGNLCREMTFLPKFLCISAVLAKTRDGLGKEG